MFDRMAAATLDDFATLGLSADSSLEAVKAAYLRLARTHHPDKGGNAEAFKRYAEAHAVLSDPEKRRVYDATGSADLAGVDLDEMMAEVFADGGWFEQQIAVANFLIPSHHYSTRISIVAAAQFHVGHSLTQQIQFFAQPVYPWSHNNALDSRY